MNEQDNRSTLINHLVELEETSVLALVSDLLISGHDPLEIIAAAQDGLRLVGERYEQRQYFITGMMMAGEIFREVMELVEPYLVKQVSGREIGNILLGTVQGDIHDIGKNIFKTLLRCHSFAMTDLGVDVPPDLFVEETIRIQPDIIALSGLLTVSYDSMRLTMQKVRHLDDPNINAIPVILGGGTVNDMVCAYVGADYWASDAMYGVQLCKQIMSAKRAVSIL